ncbi:two-partner secretion domain-containing protein [Burkholderia sp. IMCC1007]|uniref:ESPR domain-containing protein n=1 Tax=Burkholderia sp. IMCC1007 TaxID=3004104 RepID=UPI003FA46B94
MNKNTHRLVYSRLRAMVVAVAETATAEGKSATGEARARRRSSTSGAGVVMAGVAALGMLPTLSGAQIIPTPGVSTHVVQTPNGLPQVNVAKPSGAGVSVNTYNQFDVQKPGAILNNSATMVQTQQAGWINGNPNFGAGQAARIIVNQVKCRSHEQRDARGAAECNGQRREPQLDWHARRGREQRRFRRAQWRPQPDGVGPTDRDRPEYRGR